MSQEISDSTDFGADATVIASPSLEELWARAENLSIPDDRKKGLLAPVRRLPMDKQAATLQKIIRGIEAAADSTVRVDTGSKTEPTAQERADAFSKAERQVANTFTDAAIANIAKVRGISERECRHALNKIYAPGYVAE
ncbi:MAG TPA: hypothetical protein VHA78_03960 [Candidatus Peribacteraceae bacterium]|nr:hypothetical protein [Candidatus Peribacteraceae bacterium]